MACIGCGAAKTICAHLFPRAFCAQIATGWDGVRGTMVHSSAVPEQSAKIVQSGIWDKNILCATCDGLLGQYDQYAVEFSRRLYGQRIYGYSGRLPVIMKDTADPKMLLLFALSVVWRFGIITNQNFGRIGIGPYKERLRGMLLNGSPLTSNVDATLRVAKAKHDGAEHSYRTPVLVENEHLKGWWFYICGLEFLVRLGEWRRAPLKRNDQKSLWLRTANELTFVVDHFQNTAFGADFQRHFQTKPRDFLLAIGERSRGKVLST